MSFEYINNYYGTDAFKGQFVIAYGKTGQIIGTDGQYIKIRLAGQKHANNYHPTDEIVYADRNGKFPVGAL